MKKIVVFCLIVHFVCSSLYPMQLFWSTEKFDKEHATSIAYDYQKLYSYLAVYVDQISDYGVFRQSSVAAWIQEQAFTFGNVVCLYFEARNFLKKSGSSVDINHIDTNSDVNDCLKAIALRLQRVSYDILHHYAQFQNKQVFKAYSIFKKKFHYLLQYLPCNDLTLLEEQRHTWDKAIQKWSYTPIPSFFTTYNSQSQTSDKWTQKQFPCRWIEAFQWKSSCTHGIVFGLIDEQGKKVDYDRYAANIKKVYNAMLATNKHSTWTDVFASYDFPLTIQEIEKLLKLGN